MINGYIKSINDIFYLLLTSTLKFDFEFMHPTKKMEVAVILHVTWKNTDLCAITTEQPMIFCLWHSKSCSDQPSNEENIQKLNSANHNCSFLLHALVLSTIFTG